MTEERKIDCGCEDVCNLPVDELQDRTKRLRRGLLSKVQHRRALENGWSVEFAANPEMQQRLEDFVAFERKCCSSLSWNLDEPATGVLRLRVEGLPPDSEFFSTFFETNHQKKVPKKSRFWCAAKTTGFAAATALFLCCVAPVLLALILGAAAVAPLRSLDQPIVIALVAISVAIPAWLCFGPGSTCGRNGCR